MLNLHNSMIKNPLSISSFKTAPTTPSHKNYKFKHKTFSKITSHKNRAIWEWAKFKRMRIYWEIWKVLTNSHLLKNLSSTCSDQEIKKTKVKTKISIKNTTVVAIKNYRITFWKKITNFLSFRNQIMALKQPDSKTLVNWWAYVMNLDSTHQERRSWNQSLLLTSTSQTIIKETNHSIDRK